MRKNRRTVKLVMKKSSPVTKAAILAAAVLSVVAIAALYSSIDQLQNQYDVLRQQALTLESGNGLLKQRIEDLGSIESAIRIAMEELGLTFPDSVIYAPGN
ncbi:MAG: hypothetical protein J6V34_00905 [Oscillospiraceae bacterium]|nr:hypothetical protein [Oscillospiraceae bacterium]